MKDSNSIHELARRAGIMVEWRDYADRPHVVATETLKAILAALGLPAESPDDLSQSQRRLDLQELPRLITATVGERIPLPPSVGPAPNRVRLCEENGTTRDLNVEVSGSGLILPAIDAPGYHRLALGDEPLTIAVAPRRCPGVANITGAEKICGLAAQIYALRRTGDWGIGDAGGVIELAERAAALGVDMLALSPVHALFGAELRHFSPYSPSSRLFYNPLHADPRALFDEEQISRAYAPGGGSIAPLESQALIDWPRSGEAKIAAFRRLFDEVIVPDLSSTGNGRTADFQKFRAAGGKLLQDHAVFETLHALQTRTNAAMWNWTDWPSPLRDPSSAEVERFAAANRRDVTFQCFLQWLADRSLAVAQQKAKQAGMRIGLVGDLAVGMSGAGSHAWTSQGDLLTGLEIGAPPDLYNAKGQNWGLTTFSPRALVANGYSPFIATLRAGLSHAGGLRIDHAMGLLRLWVIPRGADAAAGAYLSYPLKDLLRLTALEAQRHGAVVIGEDLGTVPSGFRDTMAEAGVYGMRVLWFERAGRRFKPSGAWPAEAAAMTSTHDLPTVAGWWRGVDLDTRAEAGWIKDIAAERQARAIERRSLWRSFRRARVAEGEEPPAEQAQPAVDAAVNFISGASCDISLLPMEDALGLEQQPNVPGTIDEFPNWRRRYPAQASELLSPPTVERRIKSLARRGRQ
jgi:4-alpha-glucanotransferase